MDALKSTPEISAVKPAADPILAPRPQEHPLPPHLDRLRNLFNVSELMKVFHMLALRERLAFCRTINPQKARAAIEAGQAVAHILDENPPIPTEGIDAKSARFQQIMELLMDPQAAEFTQQLHASLKPIFQQFGITDAAIILVGSTTAGMHLRNLTGTEGKERDLDMALVYNGQGQIDFAALQEQIAQQMRHMQQGNTTDTYIPCKRANVKNHHQQVLTPETVEAFFAQPLDHLDAQKIINFLRPSIPPQVNNRQRQVILAHLQQLAISNPMLWQTQVDSILARWKTTYFVKAKYLVEPQEEENAEIANPRTQEEFNAAQGRAEEIKVQLLKDLLYATNPQTKQS